ncbi:TPA: ATP-binding protein [Candidatus Micrarchaeota archaeon]|nr:ATP-binding protein [Candidatus Micrarchaeota archaeon]
MKFVNRKSELAELNELEALAKKKLFVIALYGLRRVGKTRLLLEFLKNKGMYFFVNKNKTSADLLSEFQGILRQGKILKELEVLDSWDKFFETLITREAPPIVFDEFQNFTSVEPAVFGILQKTIDLNENKPGLIILSGSLIGLIKKLFKSSKEPLYGRIKKGKRLEPLTLISCLEIGEELKLTKENLVKAYMLFGGYPKYYVALEDFNLQGKSAEEMIDALFLVKDAPLEDEVNSILSQEFGGRSGVYYSILEAIATGNNTLSSIAGYLNTPATSITRQINELRDHFELIELEMPYQGKRGIYCIRHPLIEFWFSQIYKNFSDYAARRPEFIASVKKNLNVLYGRCFEQVAKEFLVRELKLTEARCQWGKIPQAKKGENTYEIDLIAKNEKSTYAFEFKWGELTYSEAISVMCKLQGKVKNVLRLPKDLRFGIVAKKIKDKQKLRAKGYLTYDVDDF